MLAALDRTMFRTGTTTAERHCSLSTWFVDAIFQKPEAQFLASITGSDEEPQYKTAASGLLFCVLTSARYMATS